MLPASVPSRWTQLQQTWLRADDGGGRIGTRLLAFGEPGAHPAYIEALLAARPGDTVYDESFQIDWPDPEPPGRSLRLSIEAARVFYGTTVV